MFRRALRRAHLRLDVAFPRRVGGARGDHHGIHLRRERRAIHGGFARRASAAAVPTRLVHHREMFRHLFGEVHQPFSARGGGGVVRTVVLGERGRASRSGP